VLRHERAERGGEHAADPRARHDEVDGGVGPHEGDCTHTHADRQREGQIASATQ
jgi:hypothetical protein